MSLLDERFVPLHAAQLADANLSLAAVLKWLPVAYALHDYDRGNYYLRILLSLLDAKHPITDADRVTLIHATTHWLFEPEVEIYLQLRALQALLELLKKRDIVGLTLEWRPWFEQYRALHFAGNRGLNHSDSVLSQHLKAWKKAVVKARKYFACNAPLEIYEIFADSIQPFDKQASKSIAMISLLSPTLNIDSGACQQYVDTIIPSVHSSFTLFNQSRVDVLPHYLLYARLCKHRIGAVSLMPLLPSLYTTFLQLLSLDIGKEQALVPGSAGNSILSEYSGNAIEGIAKSLASLTVSHMHCQPRPDTSERSSLSLLSQFIHIVQTYYHPSNTGKWSAPLAVFLGELGLQYAKRRGYELNGRVKYDKQQYLDSTDNSFVSILLPTVLRALFSKSQSMVGASEKWLRQVAHFHPSLVLPALLEHVYPALTDLSSPHRMLSVMQSMSKLATIIFHRQYYPQGASHFGALLDACLPGIDAIDPVKTTLTLTWFTIAFQHIPLIDARQTDGLSKSRIDRNDRPAKPVFETISAQYKDISEDGAVEHEDNYRESDPLSMDVDDVDAEDDARSVTFRFEDWSLSFLDSLFKLLSSVDKFQKRDTVDQHTLTLLHSVSKAFFNATSESIYRAVIGKLVKYLLAQHQPHAQKQLGILVANAALTHPEILLPALFDPLYSRMVVNGKLSEKLAASELNWAIYLLSRCVKRSAGSGATRHTLLQFRDKVVAVYRLTQSHSDRAVRKVSNKLLRNFLSALSSVYPSEYRPFDSRQWNASTEQWQHYNCWCSYTPVAADTDDETVVDPMTVWHVPSPEELKAVEDIVNSELDSPLRTVQDFIDGKCVADSGTDSVTVSDGDDKAGKGDGPLERALMQIVSVVRGTQEVLGDLTDDSDAVDDDDDTELASDDRQFTGSRCPAIRVKPTRPIQPIRSTIAALSSSPSTSLRSSLLSLTCSLSSKLLLSLSSLSLKSLSVTLKLSKYLLLMYGVNERKLQTDQIITGLTRQLLQEYRSGYRVTNRPLLVHRSYEYYQWRLLNSSRNQAYTPQVKQLIRNLHQFAVNDFAKVRGKAQKIVRDACFHFPQSIDGTITAIVAVLNDSNSSAEAVQGAIQTLAEPVFIALTTRRYSRLVPVIQALVALKLKGNDKVEVIVQSYYNGLYPILFPLHTHVALVSETSITSNTVLTEAHISRRNESIKAHNAKVVSQYQSLMTGLLASVSDQSLHWKYQLMAAAFLFALLRPASLTAEQYTSIVTFFTDALHSDFAPLRRIAVETILHVCAMHSEAVNELAKNTVGPPAQAVPSIPIAVPSPSASVTNSGYYTSTTAMETEDQFVDVNFYDYLFSGWRDELSAIVTQYKVIPTDSDRYAVFKSPSPFYSGHGKHLHPTRVVLTNECLSIVKQSIVDNFAAIVDSLVHNHPSLAAGVGEGQQQQSNKVIGAGEQIAHLVVSHLNAPAWPYSGLGSKSGAFDSNHLTFIRGLVESIPSLLDEPIFDKELRRLISHESEPDYQCTAAEIFAGIVVGTKHLSFQRQRSAQSLLTPIITLAMNTAVPDAVTHWTASLRHCYTNTDPRRLSWLTRLLVQSAFHTLPADAQTSAYAIKKSVSGDVSASVTATPLQSFKRFRFLVAPFVEHGYRDSALGGWVLQRLMDDGWIQSPYKQIRNEVQLLVYVITGGMFRVAKSHTHTSRDKLTIEPNSQQLAFLSTIVKRLNDSGEEKRDDDGQPPADTSINSNKHLLDTAVGLFLKCVSLGQIEQRSALFQSLLPHVIRAQHSADQELSIVAKGGAKVAAWSMLQGSLATVDSDGNISQSPVLDTEAVVTNVLAMILTLTTATSWHVRVSALKFLAITVPRHCLTMTASQVSTIEKAILASLADPQAEVREAASVALTALIASCLAHPSAAVSGFSSSRHVSSHVRQLQKTLTKMSKTTLTKGNTNALAKRHGGVLGLLAVVAVHPYDLPSHLPALLQQLSQHVNDPAPISTAVKKGFADFVRTHQDEWAEFQLRFSEAELDALHSVQSAPTYFA